MSSSDRRRSDSDGSLGVPHVKRHATTIPVSPALRTKSLSHRRESSTLSSSLSSSLSDAGSSRRSSLSSSQNSIKLISHKRKATAAKSPKFRVDRIHEKLQKRLQEKLAAEEAEREAKMRFKATPILSATEDTSCPINCPQPTVPTPFNFKTDQRHALHEQLLKQQLEEEERIAAEKRNFKANPIRDFNDEPTKTFEPRPPTQPKEFQFRTDQVHEKLTRKQQQMIEEEEKRIAEKRNFKANPIRDFNDEPTKTFEPRPPTRPKEFQFRTDQVHEKLSKKQHEILEEERKRIAELSKFSAQPVPSTHTNPYIPAPSHKDLTKTEELRLKSDEQAARRAKFEEEQRLKREEKQRQLEEMHKKMKQDEERQLRMERRKVWEKYGKATPIKRYKLKLGTPTSSSLTIPASPALRTKRRLRVSSGFIDPLKIQRDVSKTTSKFHG
ncbi:hypothetical protein P9112_000183 [Eukaryota sp. TZLM1-RC]